MRIGTEDSMLFHANSTENLKREIKSQSYTLFGVSIEHVTLHVMGGHSEGI